MNIKVPVVAAFMAFVFVTSGFAASDRGMPWQRHTIDSTSRGADGVRLADVNGDGRQDIATGWEEGGKVRVYLNPGPDRSKQPWPLVTVGNVRSPEDAVFADLDGDGAFDVVSSCEGRNRRLFVHWAPSEAKAFLDQRKWTTRAIPTLAGERSWMYCLPLQLDGKNGIDLIAGSKGKDAEIGWFESPEDPRQLSDWTWHPIYRAGWIMSLFARDMDGDKDLDILTTDRKGKNSGCHWLENPGRGSDIGRRWKVHTVGGAGREVMFMTPCDLNRDGRLDVISAVRGGDLLFFQQHETKSQSKNSRSVDWTTQTIKLPPETGTGKGVAVADINLDGRLDVVFSCENARGKSGVIWLASGPAKNRLTLSDWTAHEISGKDEGIKFDRIEMLDLDGDGDLDLLTCEERDNLGVIWYENPVK